VGRQTEGEPGRAAEDAGEVAEDDGEGGVGVEAMLLCSPEVAVAEVGQEVVAGGGGAGGGQGGARPAGAGGLFLQGGWQGKLNVVGIQVDQVQRLQGGPGDGAGAAGVDIYADQAHDIILPLSVDRDMGMTRSAGSPVLAGASGSRS